MKTKTVLLSLIFALSLTHFSCHKDDNDISQPVSSGSSSDLRTTVAGVVLDENNIPVTGVDVAAYGQHTATSQTGTFVFHNISVNSQRCIVTFNKQGFFRGSRAFIPSKETVNYVRITMLGNSSVQTIPSGSGGTINLTGGASLQFQASSFTTINGIPYSGTVSVTTKHLSPDDANFGFSIPGGDLAAKNADGKRVILYSYGMIGVELKDNSGQPLQLAAGTTATLTFPLAASQQATAPSAIPLWYFDETTSLWKEEGQATKIGNNYVGTVAHFSWWNCDHPELQATIQGKVVDCMGNPVPNRIVTVNGMMSLMADQNGYYTSWVPAGLALTFQVLPANNFGLGSQVENVSPLSAGQTFIVPDLVVPCPTRVAGNLTGCSNESVDGLAILLENGNLINYGCTSKGIFNVIAPGSTQLALNTITSFGELSQDILTPSIGTTFNTGAIQHCDTSGVITPDNSFVLNGDGFNNTLVTMDTLSNNNAYYIAPAGNTYCHNNGYGNLGYTALYLYFPTNHTGSFVLNLSPGYVDAYIVVLNKDYQGSNSGSNNQLIINVTHYGNVGELISGTFWGSISRWDGNNWVYVNISNGKFSYIRDPDVNRYAAPSSVKDDIAFWNKKFYLQSKK